MILEKINSPQDVKALNAEERKVLAQDIRDALISKLSKKGGHFGPNFGFVEATIALHTVFNSPVDKFVFDVSHQTYPHKMLTGRKDAFLHEEHYRDVTGYTNPNESDHDQFTIGHTSTSISLALGLAKARDLKGEKSNIVAVIGDGSLSGGEALEGLDYAYELGTNFIIVVNDNGMSIAENYGGLYKNLELLRNTDGKSENNIFKSFGLDYVFLKEGNDVEKLIEVFESVKDSTKPVVVHICTQKGKGYKPAEENREGWHYCVPFDVETGEAIGDYNYETYGSVTVDYLLKKMEEDPTVVAMTSATPALFGFEKEQREKAGSQFIDVGIAEENAVAMASGIAKGGAKPVYCVASTFVQRTYDQISQDLCINSNAATIPVFGGSVYGISDVTHLGLFDIPMMSNIPTLVYLAPTTKEEYLAMMDWSIEQNEYPVAIKVPGGPIVSTGEKYTKDFSDLNKYDVAKRGEKVAILGLGSMYHRAVEVEKLLKSNSIDATIINPIFITGVDKDLLEDLKKDHSVVVTIEDSILDGGFGEKIARFYGDSDMKVLNYGIKKEFLKHFDVAKVLEENRMVPELIVEDVEGLL